MAARRLRKHAWAVLGYLSLGLGLLGAVTPLLPTTVFILMAAACFTRSHPQLEQRLLQHPVFGQVIHDWRQHRGMRRGTKRLALGSMLLSFGVSIALCTQLPYVQAMLVLLWLSLSAWILHLPTLPAGQLPQPMTAPRCTLRKLTTPTEEYQDGHH
ncbi:YbaN family protein [Vogesella sp. GCM10023246]|uniref:YbaN family protein n=1 Tax=Vogesella oryzagri TaxID=3160864 RepID=A0ABV1M3J1_9NEIS